MTKTNILENLLVLINEEIEIALREDEALRMSDERREKFKRTVFSNPPNSLTEAPTPGSSVPNPEAQDLGAAPVPNTPAGQSHTDGNDNMGAEDLGASPLEGSPQSGGDLGGMSGGGTTPSGEDLGGDMGGDLGSGGDLGGGGMGGFGGGGGGGGGGMDLGGDGPGDENVDADSTAQPPETFDPFKDTSTLEDRLQVILSTAEAIAERTQDPQKVLKSVKGLIQNGFENPEQAAKAISDLFDTENPVLQQVSRRLALFTWGV